MADYYCYIAELQREIEKLKKCLDREVEKRKRLGCELHDVRKELEECISALRRETCENRSCIQELQRKLVQFSSQVNCVAVTQNKGAQQLSDAACGLRNIQCRPAASCCPPPPRPSPHPAKYTCPPKCDGDQCPLKPANCNRYADWNF